MTRDTFNANWQAFKDAMQDPDIDALNTVFLARVFLEWYDGLATPENRAIVEIAGWILDTRPEAVR